MELARLWSTKPCCRWHELVGVLRIEGIQRIEGVQGIKGIQRIEAEEAAEYVVALGHPAVARKTYRLLKESGVRANLDVRRGGGPPQRRAYRVRMQPPQRLLTALASGEVPADRCCQRAYVRGAFLGRGSVSTQRHYHLEITTDDPSVAASVKECLRLLGLAPRESLRKGVSVIYLKESEQIVETLKLMGAHGALLKMENLRIVKGMRNRVNRLVNSETANLGKTVRAAVAQLDAIRRLEREMGLGALPDSLAALARLRLQYPYATLTELGEMMRPQMSKSGVSYRMKRIVAMAAELEPDDAAPDGNEAGVSW